MVKKISILGSTGSIGISTLEVIRQFPERFQAVALSAGNNIELLKQQVLEFHPSFVAVLNEELAQRLQQSLIGSGQKPVIVFGSEGYELVATLPEVHTVVSSIVGAAGLLPTLAAIRAGKHIALANKETLVVGGKLVMDLAACKGVQILPVDSEHSAIFQALQGNQKKSLKRILLTASGGPFFRKSPEELADVTPEAALKHPNWSMGSKVTIDSATLMNKGLEVIEARWLFDTPVEQIAVHIHPESIVHSMVEYIDGSVIAQMGIPDMKIPIAYALSYPERLPVSSPQLDLFRIEKLTFYPPDQEKFPCLRLAYEACKAGSTMPAVLNASNEVAVCAFLNKQIKLPQIPEIIEAVMHAHEVAKDMDLNAVIDADRWARNKARQMINGK
jgi:1-deoxy-D-xylulose-5-phosphate reductoisomerase